MDVLDCKQRVLTLPVTETRLLSRFDLLQTDLGPFDKDPETLTIGFDLNT